MLDIYIKFKLLTIVISAALLAGAICAVVAVSVYRSAKLSRKIKLLKTSGFERYISGVPSFGGGAFYGWKNEQTGKRIDERDLKAMKYNDLLQKVQGEPQKMEENRE